MVELLGTHCEFPNCNTLDFLPIYCFNCSKTFCKQHGSAPDHSCISLLQSNAIPSNASSFLPCAFFNGCKNKKCPISFTCSLCLKNFCVEYRHVDDHVCEHWPQQTLPTHRSIPKTEVATTNFQAEKFVGTKNASLANKVALMKLKQSARGPSGVPMENRLHVFVQVDDGDGNEHEKKKRYAFYLSRLWPLGKGLDYLTNELKLSSENRVIQLDGDETPLDLSTTISDLKQLHDADVIILKKCR